MTAFTHQAPVRFTADQHDDLARVGAAMERTLAQEIRFRLFKLLPQAQGFLIRLVTESPIHVTEGGDPYCAFCDADIISRPRRGEVIAEHDEACLWRQVIRWLDHNTIDEQRRAYFAQGAGLGCPDCVAGEPHVCPFIMADGMEEPRRTTVLDHMRNELSDV